MATSSPPDPGTDRSAGPDSLPKWKQILQDLPAYTPGQHLTGDAAAKFRDRVTRSYGAGGTVRGIVAETGRSYGVVQRTLSQAQVLRPPGCPLSDRSKRKGRSVRRLDGENRQHFVARVIRERVNDGTYPPGTRIPSGVTLAKELDVSQFTVHMAVKTLKTQRVLMGSRAYTLGTLVRRSVPPS
ncbi:helix-turn-helix domain-containing protein [Streptomyces sp. NPDC002680]|uniref:helix-turn-helix domain-containing protein n=1 Tax=Streptomyces sp. NPDC002680 TaxID=3364659 RepID=UPI0036BCE074